MSEGCLEITFLLVQRNGEWVYDNDTGFVVAYAAAQ